MMERRTMKSAKIVVANSEMVADELKDYYPEYHDKIRVICNGFDPERFSVLNEKEKNEQSGLNKGEQRRICFAGNGWERKGLSTAIELLSKLKSDWRLSVLGKGDVKKMTALADTLGCANRIDFFGVVEDVERFFQTSDVFVLPTKYDPFSNACLEAMACGCPVVTTRSNGFASLIKDRENGFILDSNNLNECADWCESHLPHNREEMAGSISGYTIDQEMLHYREIFEEIFGGTVRENSDIEDEAANPVQSFVA
jgi:UDP-glucose:(heptosyl)LPS alpha-1,3-glucosyltransferase